MGSIQFEFAGEGGGENHDYTSTIGSTPKSNIGKNGGGYGALNFTDVFSGVGDDADRAGDKGGDGGPPLCTTNIGVTNDECSNSVPELRTEHPTAESVGRDRISEKTNGREREHSPGVTILGDGSKNTSVEQIETKDVPPIRHSFHANHGEIRTAGNQIPKQSDRVPETGTNAQGLQGFTDSGVRRTIPGGSDKTFDACSTPTLASKGGLRKGEEKQEGEVSGNTNDGYINGSGRDRVKHDQVEEINDTWGDNISVRSVDSYSNDRMARSGRVVDQQNISAKLIECRLRPAYLSDDDIEACLHAQLLANSFQITRKSDMYSHDDTHSSMQYYMEHTNSVFISTLECMITSHPDFNKPENAILKSMEMISLLGLALAVSRNIA